MNDYWISVDGDTSWSTSQGKSRVKQEISQFVLLGNEIPLYPTRHEEKKTGVAWACSRRGVFSRGGGAGRDPPGRLLLRAVRILLKCILVARSF